MNELNLTTVWLIELNRFDELIISVLVNGSRKVRRSLLEEFAVKVIVIEEAKDTSPLSSW